MLRSPLQKLSLNLTRGRLCTLPALCAAQRFGCKMENGQRIYTSNLPCLLDRINSEDTLIRYIDKCIRKADPKKPAMIQAETGQQYTFGELPEVIDRVAAVLYHHGGVRKGDSVCIAIPNVIQFGPLVYATLRLGARVSTVNAASDPDSLMHYMESIQAKVLVGAKFYQTTLEKAAKLAMHNMNRTIEVLYHEHIDQLTGVEPLPAGYDGISGATLDDTVFVPFSSGTTGLPKGVQLTNRCLIANCMQSVHVGNVTNADTTVSLLPFFHIFGFTCNLNCVISAGGTQIVMAKYELEKFAEVVEKYKVTYTHVAPPIIVSLTKNAAKIKKYDISSLKSLRCGAASLGAEIQQLCEKEFPTLKVLQGYGMTEMSPSTNRVPVLSKKTAPYGCSGQLMPSTEMRIVKVDDSQQSGADKSAGIDAEEGEEGEIWFRGPQMMKGYLKKEDTDKCMQDGWYRTGDIGYVDKDENLFVTDRLKELIKYKGFQVSPAQLEGVLLDHPWVSDCIVMGVSDPRNISFEVPRALVVLKSDLPASSADHAVDNILEFITKRLPPHQRLHGGVRIVDQIPKNASGKLLRRIARHDETEFLKKVLERDGHLDAEFRPHKSK